MKYRYRTRASEELVGDHDSTMWYNGTRLASSLARSTHARINGRLRFARWRLWTRASLYSDPLYTIRLFVLQSFVLAKLADFEAFTFQTN